MSPSSKAGSLSIMNNPPSTFFGGGSEIFSSPPLETSSSTDVTVSGQAPISLIWSP